MNAPAKIKAVEATPAHESFYEAFVKLQAEIRPAIKDATNPAFRSKYADLGAVWEAVREPLAQHGFGVVQAPQFEGETMWLETTLLHVSGDTMVSRYPLRPVKPDPQGFGSAITYAKRYALSAMLGVIADEDDDGNAASGRNGHAAPAKPVEEDPRVDPVRTVQTEDPDVIEGVKNWCAAEKAKITAASRLPDLYMWLDANGENWTKPIGGSQLDRARRKAPEAFEELKRHYQAKLSFLNKGRAST